MANTLDADPGLAKRIKRMMGADPLMVPVAIGGKFYGWAGDHVVEQGKAPLPLSAADYVVGLELLGFRFELGHDGSGLYTLDPSFRISEAWRKRSLDLMRAFPRSCNGDVIDYLLARDGASA